MERAVLPRRSVAGTIGEHQEQRLRGHAVDERTAVFLGVAVHPLQVLGEQHERLMLGAAQRERLDRVDEPPLALHLIESFALELVRGQAEDVTQIRHGPRERRVEPLHAGRHFLGLHGR